MRAGVESTSHHADNLKGNISMNALYTHLCLYISGAYNKMNARLDAKRESGAGAVEYVLLIVLGVAIVGLIAVAVKAFVEGQLGSLTFSV
jgi:hypothetical protein